MFHHFQTKLFFLNIDSEAIECEKTQLKQCEFPADISTSREFSTGQAPECEFL